MLYNQLIVLSDAADGRDDEYNDWYTWVHIRDVMRLSPVVIAVQRFKKAAKQLTPGGSAKYLQPYLAIYENTDPARMSADHKPVFTHEMPIATAYSIESTCEGYYDTAAVSTKVVGGLLAADVIVERIERRADDSEIAAWYAAQRFPKVMNLPGVIAGVVGTVSDHQMHLPESLPALTAIYRTTDIAASLKAWAPCGKDAPKTLKADEVTVDCYTPIIDRVTSLQVREPDAISRDTAARKRAEMGDKVFKDLPEGVNIDFG